MMLRLATSQYVCLFGHQGLQSIHDDMAQNYSKLLDPTPFGTPILRSSQYHAISTAAKTRYVHVEESFAVLPRWLCRDRPAFRWMAGRDGACFYIENCLILKVNN